MKTLSGPAAAAVVARLAQRNARLDSFESRVRAIVRAVRREGDRALRRYLAVLRVGQRND